MKILIDIGHPAHVHYFKNFANEMISSGSEVVFTCRDKEITISLLKHYKLNYINFGKPYKSIYGKIYGLFYFTLKLFVFSIKFKPDVLLNASMYSAFVAWILKKPHISLEDTYNNEQVKLYRPFTSCILSGDYNHPYLGAKELLYSGYQELLYLHPKRFKPNPLVLEKLGLNVGEKYTIVRFVAWNASHDIGHRGLSLKNKIDAVNQFSKFGKVFISSESELDSELNSYKFNLKPHEMHDALAFASLVYGESATMVSEGAMLGTPGIYIDNTGRYYTKDLEMNYGMVYNYSESIEDQLLSIQKGIEILKNENRESYVKKKDSMIQEKIDVTSLLIWLVNEWPNSKIELSNNENKQLDFK
jgi:uncharacterized protein